MSTATSAGEAGPGDRRARLLIVDADPRVRGALAALVESAGHLGPVVACARADEAEVLAAAVLPDVALVDVLLGASDDGLRLVRRFATAGIPVIAMSVRGGLRTEAMAAGASAFLEKDGTPDAILSTLLQAMRVGYVNRPPSSTPLV